MQVKYYYYYHYKKGVQCAIRYVMAAVLFWQCGVGSCSCLAGVGASEASPANRSFCRPHRETTEILGEMNYARIWGAHQSWDISLFTQAKSKEA